MKNFDFKSFDGFILKGSKLLVNDPLGNILIIHGAKEHKERYYTFAKYLNNEGYNVFLVDNRGHGSSLSDDYPLGYLNNYEKVILDIHSLVIDIKKNYSDIPIYLFGHSLGSMFTRIYLEKFDNEIDKLVLSGTVNYNPLGIIGIWTGTILKLFKGSFGYSKLLEKMARFTSDEWVVKNKEAKEKYRADTLCNYKYPIDSMLMIFKINRELNKKRHFKCQNKDLPILLVSGEEDPITGGNKGLKHTIKILTQIGYHDILNLVYKDMAHEVLNEKNNECVMNDIVTFLKYHN